jgi:hypothetical protein
VVTEEEAKAIKDQARQVLDKEFAESQKAQPTVRRTQRIFLFLFLYSFVLLLFILLFIYLLNAELGCSGRWTRWAASGRR